MNNNDTNNHNDNTYICMYVCIYIYIYTRISLYIYIYTHSGGRKRTCKSSEKSLREAHPVSSPRPARPKRSSNQTSLEQS